MTDDREVGFRRFASGLAHEINNFLGIIVGNAHLLKRQLRDDDSASASLHEIEIAIEECRMLMKTVGQLGSDRNANTRSKSIAPVIHQMLIDEAKQHPELVLESSIVGYDDLVMVDVAGLIVPLQEAIGAWMKSVPAGGQFFARFHRNDDLYLCIELADDGPALNDQDAVTACLAFQKLPNRPKFGLLLTALADTMIRQGGRVVAQSSKENGLALLLEFRRAPSEMVAAAIESEEVVSVALDIADERVRAIAANALEAMGATVVDIAQRQSFRMSDARETPKIGVLMSDGNADRLVQLKLSFPEALAVHVGTAPVEGADATLAVPFTRQSLGNLLRRQTTPTR
ncbi:MAG: histidine kinase dimerization/phospho-acceptor domain-containing protein [Polyangiales bacterium]